MTKTKERYLNVTDRQTETINQSINQSIHLYFRREPIEQQQHIIIIIIRHAPCQCVAPLATNSLHSGLSKASSIASSKVRLCRDRSLFKVAIQEV